MPIDLVLAGSGLEDEFLGRARELDAGGVVVPVISPEDLIVAKILAGRPKDVADVEGILRARSEDLDLDRIRSVLRLLEEAIAQSDLLAAFDAIARRIRR